MRARILSLLLVATACEAPSESASRPRARPTKASPAPRSERAGTYTIERARMSSPALGVDKRFFVALPPGYEADMTKYPVVYFLHGFGGRPENWTREAPAAAEAAGLRAILVMVDGDDSFYVDSATPPDYERCRTGERRWGPVDVDDYCVKHGRYEQYVVRDLVAHVDRQYRTRADREGRALAGFSMGGFGALMLAMRNPDVFSAAVSHAGVDSLLYVRGERRRLTDLSGWGREYEREIEGIGDHVRALLGPDIARWREHDPVALAERIRDGQLRLYLDCGTEDEFGFDDLAQDLHEALERRGIGHRFTLVRGGHDGDFLRERLDDGMRFLAEGFLRRR